MNEELQYLYDDIIALDNGDVVYNVIPDVLPENIDSWRKQLLDEGFFVNIDFFGSTTNIYYASPNYVEENYGEYTMNGWTN